jgi:hypothetical protein
MRRRFLPLSGVAIVAALAGCGSSATPRTPIGRFNQCVSNGPAGLVASSPPTLKVNELIVRQSDNYAIATVFLFSSRQLANQFARDTSYNSQFGVARNHYVVSVYNQLPRRYATAIAGCVHLLPATS